MKTVVVAASAWSNGAALPQCLGIAEDGEHDIFVFLELGGQGAIRPESQAANKHSSVSLSDYCSSGYPNVEAMEAQALSDGSSVLVIRADTVAFEPLMDLALHRWRRFAFWRRSPLRYAVLVVNDFDCNAVAEAIFRGKGGGPEANAGAYAYSMGKQIWIRGIVHRYGGRRRIVHWCGRGVQLLKSLRRRLAGG